jgi:hypothetical protein
MRKSDQVSLRLHGRSKAIVERVENGRTVAQFSILHGGEIGRGL